MKKILVMAAVIVAGIAANAASFKWTASNIYSPTDSTVKLASTTATLYAYAQSANIGTAIEVATATTTSAGAISQSFTADGLTGGNYYNFYFVIDTGDYTFTSSNKEGVLAQATSTAAVSFGSMAAQTGASGNWQSVPEPTSGLLMLLGMAGLALKRKRA